MRGIGHPRTRRVFDWVRADEKLTAFLELESAIRARPAVGWQRVVRRRFHSSPSK
jgi:hypothetical protein